MGEQTFDRWFVDYPSTHRLAGQTVEVIPVVRIADLEAEVEKQTREHVDAVIRAQKAEAEAEKLRKAGRDVVENFDQHRNETHALDGLRAALASLEGGTDA